MNGQTKIDWPYNSIHKFTITMSNDTCANGVCACVCVCVCVRVTVCEAWEGGASDTRVLSLALNILHVVNPLTAIDAYMRHENC